MRDSNVCFIMRKLETALVLLEVFNLPDKKQLHDPKYTGKVIVIDANETLDFVSPFLNNSVHIHIIYLASCYSLSSGESTRNSLEGVIITIKCIIHYLANSRFEFQ